MKQNTLVSASNHFVSLTVMLISNSANQRHQINLGAHLTDNSSTTQSSSPFFILGSTANATLLIPLTFEIAIMF